MTDQYTEISFNAGETLKASQLNTVVQNINIINTQVENISTAIAGKADKPAGNESYATVTYVGNKINDINYPVTKVNGKTGEVSLSAADVGALPNTTEIPSIAGLATEDYVDNEIAAIADDLSKLQISLNLSAGTSNSFAVSDGKGNITWLKISLAENTTY